MCVGVLFGSSFLYSGIVWARVRIHPNILTEDRLFATTLDDGRVLALGDRGAMSLGEIGGEWFHLPPVTEDLGSFGMSTVWTGDEVIHWGGRAAVNGGGSLASGIALRIDPVGP